MKTKLKTNRDYISLYPQLLTMARVRMSVVPYNLDPKDIVQEAYTGHVQKWVATYDPSRGLKLSHHVAYRFSRFMLNVKSRRSSCFTLRHKTARGINVMSSQQDDELGFEPEQHDDRAIAEFYDWVDHVVTDDRLNFVTKAIYAMGWTQVEVSDRLGLKGRRIRSLIDHLHADLKANPARLGELRA